MTPEQIGFLVGALIGGLCVGALCGLLPFFVGQRKNRPSLSVAGLITCIVCGGILGLLLAVPVSIIFTLVIVLSGKPPGQSDYDKQALASSPGTDFSDGR